MTTFTFHYENDFYEVSFIGLGILVLKRNNKPISFSQCPEEAQELIVARMEDNVIKKTNNPYESI